MSATRNRPDARSSVPRRSWYDVVLDGIDRLPGPAWAFYLVATVLFVVAGTGLRWMDGTLPVGTLSFPRIGIDILAVYGLAAMHHARWAARRALVRFRPTLGELEPRYPEFERRLTTLGPTSALVTAALATAFTVGSLSTTPAAWDITPDASTATVAFFIVEGFLLDVGYAGLILMAFRQIRIVTRLHREATNVRLLETHPHSGFSPLTLTLSILVGLPVYASATSYAIAGLFFVGVGVFDIVAIVLAVTSAGLIFIVPLIGLHRRLVRQKSAALDRVGRGFTTASDLVHTRIDNAEFEGIGEMKTALEALAVERDELRRARTWPWQVETLRGFVSSIALPILLWVVTTLLGRILA